MDDRLIAGPLVRRQKNGDLAERARALVAKTRAGLGTRKDEDMVSTVHFNLDFIDELSRLHSEKIRQARDLNRQTEQQEMDLIRNGVIGFLDEIADKYPSTRKVASKCQEILQGFTDDVFESDERVAEFDPSGDELYDDAPGESRPAPMRPSTPPGRPGRPRNKGKMESNQWDNPVELKPYT